jgi:hypothetical protein
MAIERKLALIIVTAALGAVTVGCGSPPATVTGPGGSKGAAGVNEAGVQKKIPKNFSPAAQDAMRAMKGSDNP